MLIVDKHCSDVCCDEFSVPQIDRWWRSDNITRTQNVSEYMLVLALCLVRVCGGMLKRRHGTVCPWCTMLSARRDADHCYNCVQLSWFDSLHAHEYITAYTDFSESVTLKWLTILHWAHCVYTCSLTPRWLHRELLLNYYMFHRTSSLHYSQNPLLLIQYCPLALLNGRSRKLMLLEHKKSFF